jgi:hypothetical protein
MELNFFGILSMIRPIAAPFAWGKAGAKMVALKQNSTMNPFIGVGLEYDNNDYSRLYEYLNVLGKGKGGINDFLLYGAVKVSVAESENAAAKQKIQQLQKASGK